MFHLSRSAERVRRPPDVSLLAISRDAQFLARVEEAVAAWSWDVKQQPDLYSFSLARASAGPVLIVLLDSESPGVSWEESLAALREDTAQPCVILASPVCDEYLSREVVRRGGFDVIGKNAPPERLAGMLRFAEFWKRSSPRSRAS